MRLACILCMPKLRVLAFDFVGCKEKGTCQATQPTETLLRITYYIQLALFLTDLKQGTSFDPFHDHDWINRIN